MESGSLCFPLEAGDTRGRRDVGRYHSSVDLILRCLFVMMEETEQLRESCLCRA